MIKSFKHKGLREFFESGNRAGIQPAHESKLRRQLGRLNDAKHPADMNLPGWDFHQLQGDQKGFFAVSVNGNWRLTFRFDDQDAEVVDYQDYH